MHWVKSRKLKLMSDIEKGVISKEKAMKDHSISEEELDSWYKAVEKHGEDGLKVTNTTRYRKADTDKQK